MFLLLTLCSLIVVARRPDYDRFNLLSSYLLHHAPNTRVVGNSIANPPSFSTTVTQTVEVDEITIERRSGHLNCFREHWEHYCNRSRPQLNDWPYFSCEPQNGEPIEPIVALYHTDRLKQPNVSRVCDSVWPKGAYTSCRQCARVRFSVAFSRAQLCALTLFLDS